MKDRDLHLEDGMSATNLTGRTEACLVGGLSDALRLTSDDRHFRPLSCASSAPERTARRVCGSSRLVTVSL